MVGIFALSQTGYYLAGVRFDTSSLRDYLQLLDPELLKDRLAESLFYLQSQPPLFNLFLGIVFKLFPHHHALAFATAYLAMGLGIYLSLFALMQRAGVSRAIALALSTWFAVSPSFVLYGHWLLYTFPLALLLTTSCLVFSSSVQRPRFRSLLGLFSILLVICALRSTFHLAFFLLVMVGLLAFRWRHRRTILLAALAPLLLLVALYAKNYLLFGNFSTTSWFGMNFSGVTVRAVPIQTRQKLVDEGKLTPLAMIPRFSDLSAYPPEYAAVAGFEGIPVLRQTRKSNGAPNSNHLAYIAISAQYLKDDLYVVRHHPQYLLVGWLNSWLNYFRSTTDYALLFGNLRHITPVNVLYDYLCYGKVPWYRLRLGSIPLYFAPGSEPRVYAFLLLGLPALVVFGIRQALRAQRNGLALDGNQRLLLLYLCFNIVYVALVGNTFEVSENNRFRFATDPLYVVLLGLVIERLRRRRTLWNRGGRTESDPDSERSALSASGC